MGEKSSSGGFLRFSKNKKQNVMKEEHIEHVLELYQNRETVDKEAYLASFEDIKENDFNLNIPRYVDTSEEEEAIDLKALTSSIKDTNDEIKKCNQELLSMFGEMTFNSTETEEAVKEFVKIFGEV